jgi:hypothetical protein
MGFPRHWSRSAEGGGHQILEIDERYLNAVVLMLARLLPTMFRAFAYAERPVKPE